MNKLPVFRAHLGRHGHNLTHDFSFTSGTGHLLTLMSYLMYPKDTIQGKCEMFTRTQPLLNPANCEIDEYIDYFFVPLDMLMSGFGDFIYQVNEPYSSITKANLSSLVTGDLTLPVFDFDSLVNELDLFQSISGETIPLYELKTDSDYYGKDWKFLSVYRNIFHNYLNPNSLFSMPKHAARVQSATSYVFPIDTFQPNVLPLTQMAYNCVYEHIYRIDDREEFKPDLYNIDKDIYDSNSIFSGRANHFFSLKYRPKHFDYFTCVNPSPFVNSQNILVNSGGANNLYKVNNYLSSLEISGVGADNNYVSVDSITQLRQYNTGGVGNILSTSTFRSLFAVEKLLSITQRAKKTYDAQVMAHLGVDVPHDVLHQVIKIGTQHTQIKIGEVVSTAGTADTPLGDIAGKGYAVLPDKGIKFTAPCHGMFIAIYSAVPRFRYYAPLPKHAQVSNLLDFFVPEYEKLGMQPVYGYEGTPVMIMSTEQGDTAPVGWQMRYEQYKRLYNRVSPAFVDTILQSYDTNPQSDTSQVLQQFNSWHNWTIVRRPFDFFTPSNTHNVLNRVELGTLLCGSAELNGLMAVDYFDAKGWNDWKKGHPTLFKLNDTYNNAPGERDSIIWNLAQLFYRDPLMHFCKPSFTIVNKMNDNTLPDFVC